LLQLERLAREVVARWECGDLAEAARALDQHLQDIAEDRVRHADLIERAIGIHADEDAEIGPEDTFISESEEGAFVMGWLWVSGRDGDAAIDPEQGAQPP
jgi:hypothetical protein